MGSCNRLAGEAEPGVWLSPLPDPWHCPGQPLPFSAGWRPLVCGTTARPGWSVRPEHPECPGPAQEEWECWPLRARHHVPAHAAYPEHSHSQCAHPADGNSLPLAPPGDTHSELAWAGDIPPWSSTPRVWGYYRYALGSSPPLLEAPDPKPVRPTHLGCKGGWVCDGQGGWHGSTKPRGSRAGPAHAHSPGPAIWRHPRLCRTSPQPRVAGRTHTVLGSPLYSLSAPLRSRGWGRRRGHGWLLVIFHSEGEGVQLVASA